MNTNVIFKIREVMELLYGIFGPERAWCKDNTAHDIKTNVKYPPYSGDLNGCDYWLFSYIERLVFSDLPNYWPKGVKVADMFDLKQKLQVTVRYINENKKDLIVKAVSNFLVSLK